MSIEYPYNLPKSKEHIYVKAINCNYIKVLHLINDLGGVLTLDQFIRLYKMYNPNMTDSSVKRKVQILTKDLESMNIISSDKINTYKYYYLKRLGLSFVSGDYNKYPKLNMSQLLKNNRFITQLLKVEYFIENKKFLSTKTIELQLVAITNDIFKAKLKKPTLPYEISILKQIIADKGIKNCKEIIYKLPQNNLLRIIWVDIYNIFYTLKLQGQTIDYNPLYYKLYLHNNALYLHYIPKIIIFDVHNKKYYVKKIQDLFNKFLLISDNTTLQMQKYFREEHTLGFEGQNHIAYVLKLIGTNKYELIEKKKYLDAFLKDNPNAILVSNCSINYIDVSKYFKHSSTNIDVIENIDLTFQNLIAKKLNK